MKDKLRFLMLCFIVMILLHVFSASPAKSAVLRIAILPFGVHAEKNMTFLQEGILDMLGSRLAWQDKVTVINKNEIKTALTSVEGVDGESRAVLVGSKLQADYVLFGSLTVIGESVSIDAKMMTVNGRRAELPFFAQTNDMGGLVPQLNQFATNINETVFGRSIDKPAVDVPDTRPDPVSVVQHKALSPVDGTDMQSNKTPNPAFIAVAPTRSTSTSSRTFWKSRKMKTSITGLEISDVDSDGRKEVIVVSEKLVSIYRFENQLLAKAAEVAATRTDTYISVDAADINGNGIPEIYVSSLGSNRTTVDSFVLEYANNEYNTISDADNWYYRVVHTYDKGTILFGQRQRMGEKSIYDGAIHEMIWKDDGLVPGRQLVKGGKANLIGVTCGDFTQSGQDTIIAYSDGDRIRVYNDSGEVIWEDGNRTGGNATYFDLPKMDPANQTGNFSLSESGPSISIGTVNPKFSLPGRMNWPTACFKIIDPSVKRNLNQWDGMVSVWCQSGKPKPLADVLEISLSVISTMMGQMSWSSAWSRRKGRSL